MQAYFCVDLLYTKSILGGMKNKKEIRKKSLITLKPSIQREAARIAFLQNVSFSRLVENLLIREIEKIKAKA